MFGALVKRNAKKCLGIVEYLVGTGTDIRYFMQELMAALHEELLGQIRITNHELREES